MQKWLSLVIALVIPQAVAAHHTPSHSTCAPVEYLQFGGFYELLNDPQFIGTHSSCTPWSSASVTTSAACSNNKVAVVTPGGGYFSQNFTVPADSTGELDLRVIYADIGTPASTGDRIVFELYEGSTLRGWTSVYTIGASPCHSVDKGFGSTDYSGKNLQLRVWAPFVTPGVSYHIDMIQIFTYFE
jgi:hypothetical protein